MTESRPISDSELIRSAQKGSEAALEALYQRYLPPVWRYVYAQIGRDRHAADDVVSETFLAAVRGLKGLNPDGGPFYSWLMGVARHKLGDHRRRARRAGGQPASPNVERTGQSRPPDPSAGVGADEARAEVAKAMSALTDEERLALEWKYIEELSVEDIAARLGRTPKAAEAVLYRARKSFRAIYQGLQGAGG